MSSESSSSPSTKNLILGFLVLAVVFIAGCFGVYGLYRWIKPAEKPGKIALSAYFETPGEAPLASYLKIEGQVQHKGAPLKQGQVHVTVNRLNGDLRQSLMLPLDEKGQFVLERSPALSALKSRDKLYVEASAFVGDTVVAEEIVYLQTRKPLIAREKLLVGGTFVSVLMLIIFLLAFTGPESANRNRLAITFSYIVIALFFVLPMAAPVVISQAYPDLQKIMEETPVGLVHGIVPEKNNANPAPQWYLNIGGVVKASEEGDKPAEILGGLAIPFFILVLATMGGVINMTRKVPEVQDDAESNVLDLFGMRRFVNHIVPRMAASLRAPGQPRTGRRENEGKPDGSEMRSVTPEWRIELVKQYMYLVSAPFLGIVTYYLLIWLDFRQIPVVVLVSFAVGLISDTIVEKIIEVVGGFLRKSQKERRREENAPATGKKKQSRESAAEDRQESEATA